MEVTESEASIIRVESSYRLRLPQALCKRLNWLVDGPARAWLLVGTPGRCRMLPSAEVDASPELRALAARIAEQASDRSSSIVEFHDEASVGLTQRLVEIQMTKHTTSGWRFTLPRVVAAIMQLRPEASELAVLLVQGRVELWTLETLRAAVSQPLPDIL
ncbi:MAG: hypothetical protein WA252_18105 [Candidatus Sulfotelmatobacter sp.]